MVLWHGFDSSHFTDEKTETQSLNDVSVGHTAKMETAEPQLIFVFWLKPMMSGTEGQVSMVCSISQAYGPHSLREAPGSPCFLRFLHQGDSIQSQL